MDFFEIFFGFLLAFIVKDFYDIFFQNPIRRILSSYKIIIKSKDSLDKSIMKLVKNGTLKVKEVELNDNTRRNNK